MPSVTAAPVTWNPFTGRTARDHLHVPAHTHEPSTFFIGETVDVLSLENEAILIGVVREALDNPAHTFLFATANPVKMWKIIDAEAGVRDTSRIWIGATVNTQAHVDERIPELLGIWTKNIFAYCSLRGMLDLTEHMPEGEPRVEWVIASAYGRNPVHPLWLRRLRDQCVLNNTAFRFTGWGDWAENVCVGSDGVKELHVPRSLSPNYCALHADGKIAMTMEHPYNPFDHDPRGWTVMRRTSSKDSGRALDGREWDEQPCDLNELETL